MKKFIQITVFFITLSSCKPEIQQGKSIGIDIKKIYSGEFYLNRIYIMKLDSIQYIIACSDQGVSIIPKVNQKAPMPIFTQPEMFITEYDNFYIVQYGNKIKTLSKTHKVIK